MGEKGTLFVSSRVAGQVYAVVDKGGSREVKVIAKGLTLPNGVAFKDGTLYVAEVSKIWKLEKIEDNLDSPGEPKMVVRHAAEGHAARLEVPRLRSGRQALLQHRRALQHLPAARHPREPLARESRRHRLRVRRARRAEQRGLRLAPGVEEALLHATHAPTGSATSCRTTAWQDVVSKKGGTSATLFCHRGYLLDPEFGKGKSCNDYVKPILKTGPHIAGNGVEFYTGSMFPAEYKNRMFLAQRGSWNRTKKIGFRVAMVTLDARVTRRSTSRSRRAGCRGRKSGVARCTRAR